MNVLYNELLYIIGAKHKNDTCKIVKFKLCEIYGNQFEATITKLLKRLHEVSILALNVHKENRIYLMISSFCTKQFLD